MTTLQPMPERVRYIGDEDQVQIWWERNGALIDFSAGGYTYEGKLADIDTKTVVFTKTTGFTGAAGAGTEQSGTPNLVIDWATSGEMNSVTSAGRYLFQVKATLAGAETTYQMIFDMRTRL